MFSKDYVLLSGEELNSIVAWLLRLTEDCPTLLWLQCNNKWLRDIRDIAVHLHHLSSIRLKEKFEDNGIACIREIYEECVGKQESKLNNPPIVSMLQQVPDIVLQFTSAISKTQWK